MAKKNQAVNRIQVQNKISELKQLMNFEYSLPKDLLRMKKDHKGSSRNLSNKLHRHERRNLFRDYGKIKEYQNEIKALKIL